MARPKRLINFAHLNDQHGDVTKCWFVEYSFRLPQSDQMYRRRIYDGLGTGTAEQRHQLAARIIDHINDYLKSGEYLNHDADYSPVGLTDSYRPEQQRYDAALARLQVRSLVPAFLTERAPSLRKKSNQDYKAKMEIFCDWWAEHGSDAVVTNIQRCDVLPFFSWLATDKNLCRKTIEKYMQIVRAFFNWCEDKQLRPERSNPVYRVPKYGRVIDCSPLPYTEDERERLKLAIEDREPYLWLACQMIYYGAIRPGTELRLLRVGDIDRESRTIRIRAEVAKNKRTQIVKMADTVIDQMERLGVFCYSQDMYLFGKYGRPGIEPMGKNTMRNRFNEYRELLKISRNKTFYAWKHTGAISAIDSGIDIMQLKDHLRHTSVATTEAYISKWRPKTNEAEKYIEKL